MADAQRDRQIGSLAGRGRGGVIEVEVAVDRDESDRLVRSDARGRDGAWNQGTRATEYDGVAPCSEMRCQTIPNTADRRENRRITDDAGRQIATGPTIRTSRSLASIAPSASTIPAARNATGASSVPPGRPRLSIGTATITGRTRTLTIHPSRNGARAGPPCTEPKGPGRPAHSDQYDAHKRVLQAELANLEPPLVADVGDGAAALTNFAWFWQQETDPGERNKLLRLIFERITIANGQIVSVTPRDAFLPYFPVRAGRQTGRRG